ncbi:hypothetical protein V1289_001028 [Bradyrhizobium sp. AZCC 2289]
MLSMAQREEQAFVEQPIPYPAIEALTESVLHGLAQRK